MEEVNALKIRNNLGEILDRLNQKGEPILISKGRKIRAVLVTPEQFEKRFLDWQAQEEKKRLLEEVQTSGKFDIKWFIGHKDLPLYRSSTRYLMLKANLSRVIGFKALRYSQSFSAIF
jgi:PHD/YefM family antitoxin component YafN of YafNO toxin-antitoxin module